MLTKIVYFYG